MRDRAAVSAPLLPALVILDVLMPGCDGFEVCRPGDSITVRLSVLPEGVRCAVADSGPGIADADLPHVRAPLNRGRTNVEGSGIGLALVDEIVRRHHTTLEIESAADTAQSGTVRSWTLPSVLVVVG